MRFLPGETEKMINIAIVDDMRVEQTEVFEVYLTGGTEVHLSPHFRAEITLQDNDGILYQPVCHACLAMCKPVL